ncbi:uncharacterized protein [Zea mays]|uniref:uncharacterized protein n=1 Tax=Zea mays TaxID=4577 RepID=UPI001652D530|nr:uncharacterized protein LOC103639018 [Zea mays]
MWGILAMEGFTGAHASSRVILACAAPSPTVVLPMKLPVSRPPLVSPPCPRRYASLATPPCSSPRHRGQPLARALPRHGDTGFPDPFRLASMPSLRFVLVQERLHFLYESRLAVGKSSEGFQALQQSTPGPASRPLLHRRVRLIVPSLSFTSSHG